MFIPDVLPSNRIAAASRPVLLFLASLLGWGGVLSCPVLAQDPPAAARARGVAELTVTSPAFADNTRLPESTRSNLLGCNGQNRSPALAWDHVPAETRSIAIEMIEPDGVAGVDYTHWIVFNLPGGERGLPEGAGSAGGPAASANTMSFVPLPRLVGPTAAPFFSPR